MGYAERQWSNPTRSRYVPVSAWFKMRHYCTGLVCGYSRDSSIQCCLFYALSSFTVVRVGRNHASFPQYLSFLDWNRTCSNWYWRTTVCQVTSYRCPPHLHRLPASRYKVRALKHRNINKIRFINNFLVSVCCISCKVKDWMANFTFTTNVLPTLATAGRLSVP